MASVSHSRPRRPRKDLLSAAQGTEIEWKHAAPLLRGIAPGTAEFVYVIGEQNDGPVKIGNAVDPVKRLRELQTGNPRRLKIEALIYGDRRTEQLLHAYWRPHVIGGKTTQSELNPTYARETEWFQPSARVEILAAVWAIADEQLALAPEIPGARYSDFLVGEHMAELGREIHLGDEVLHLGTTLGYASRQLRPQ